MAYDGTDFNGWGRQPGLRTVQGVLEEALERLFHRAPPAPKLTVAGRTDAGVHALGQVAHLDLSPEHCEALRCVTAGEAAAALGRKLTGILGGDSDIVIGAVRVAPPGFDARFSALWRSYQYRVVDRTLKRDPLRRRYELWHPTRLDRAGMKLAAKSLTGLRDFGAFCRPREGATTIRTLHQFQWEGEEGEALVARLIADAFCHNMVRALIGACIAVGEGRLSLEQLLSLRDDAIRTSAFRVVPAQGLTLLEIGYPDDADLAARAVQTRGRRTLPPNQ